MQNASMSNGDIISKYGWVAGIIVPGAGTFFMDGGVVLNVTETPDPNRIDIGAKHAIVPDTCAFGQFKVTDQFGTIGYKGIGVKLRGISLKSD